MNCRICNNKTETILDLGSTPPANSLLDSPDKIINSYPLNLEYCPKCSNLQLRDCLDSKDLYKDYFYITPDSTTLSDHYEYLTSFLIKKKYLNKESNVLEVGSNIGNYLKFLRPHVNEILGVDPAKNIVEMANKRGIKTICEFFGKKVSEKIKNNLGELNCIVARHCFAHNSSPHDLLQGAKELLVDDGVLVIENAYALNTLENNEFDQIYHEHMFYYSIQSMSKALEINGLKLVDVLISLVHGGSIIFVATHKKSNMVVSNSVKTHLEYEILKLNKETLKKFASNAFNLKKELKKTIQNANKKGELIYTYGATAKGNTLLNFVGLTNKEINYCVDSTNIKQGKYLPGSKIKIVNEDFSRLNPPSHFLLTAWNYKDEIINKVRKMGNLDSTFIIPFPNLHMV